MSCARITHILGDGRQPLLHPLGLADEDVSVHLPHTVLAEDDHVRPPGVVPEAIVKHSY